MAGFVLFFCIKNAHKGLLRDLNAADTLHSLFAFFLPFEDFHLAGNISTVEFCCYIFPEGLDAFARDYFSADSGLQRYLELMARNCFSEPDKDFSSPCFRVRTMDYQTERINYRLVYENIYPDKVAGFKADEFVIHRCVAPAYSLELVVKIIDNLGKRGPELHHHS